MSHRVVEISRPSFLSTTLQHLVVEQEGAEVGRVPIEDLGVLLLDSYGIVLTQELLVRLSKHQVTVIVCDEKHMPTGSYLAHEGHHRHAEIVREQAAASEPVKKRLWQQTVQAKVRNQAEAVRRNRRGHYRKNAAEIEGLVPFVRSGDPDNIEARAARLYWEALFGSDFMRNREEPGANAALNYGYAVIRAACARALVGTGLHPAFGIFHRNAYNAFTLADDLMEPWRPMVDLQVAQWLEAHGPDAADVITPALKRHLLEVLVLPVVLAGKRTPPAIGIPLCAASYKQVLCGEKRKSIAPEFAAGADTESCG